MNRVDFTQQGGFPLDQEILALLQDNSDLAASAAMLGGPQYILSGCIVNGSNVSNGRVFFNNEILPFVGGIIGTKVIVVETITNLTYEDNAVHGSQAIRYATFGDDGITNILWSDFKRNETIGLLSRVDKIEKMLKPLLGYTVGNDIVYGSWLFWGRPANEIPEGWEAVPDAEWKGKVPVVFDADQVEFNEVGKTGGEKDHTLTVSEIPDITNGGQAKGVKKTGTNTPAALDNSADEIDLKSTVNLLQGGGQSHNNLQPYRVVLFIRFIG